MNRAKSFFLAATLLVISGPALARIDFFRSPELFTVSRVPEFFAVGDFDRDGVDDLVLSAKRSDELNFLVSDDNSRFRFGTTQFMGRVLQEVAVGDINQDTLLDVVVVDSPGRGARGIWISLGRGDGTFRESYFVSIDGLRNPYALALADYDIDGDVDVAVSDLTTDQIHILFNDGQALPSVSAMGDFRVDRDPEKIIAEDFDGDGDPDMVILNAGGPRGKNITLMRNDGVIVAGGPVSFRLVANFAVGEDPFSLVAADVNGDELPDIVMANNPRNTRISEIGVLLARAERGELGFDGPIDTDVPCPFNNGSLACRVLALTAGDYDQDGRTDVAVTIRDARDGALGDFMSIFRGRGDGNFIGRLTIDTSRNPRTVTTGNFLLGGVGEGFPDIALGTFARGAVELFGNISTRPAGNGEGCQDDDDCDSEICDNGICCGSVCFPDETCAAPCSLGDCVPLKELGEDCGEQMCIPPEADQTEYGRECFSEFCVDGSCCDVAECPEGRRCDIFGKEGMCSPLAGPGTQCDEDAQCTTGFCVDGVCCTVPACFDGEACTAPDGMCRAAPTPTRTPGGPGTGCATDDDCEDPLFCTDGVCCVRSSCAPFVCGPNGECDAGPTRTRTPTQFLRPTQTAGPPTIKTSRGGGCWTGEGMAPTGADLLIILLLPLAMWLRKMPTPERVRSSDQARH